MAEKGAYDAEFFEHKEEEEDRYIPEAERDVWRGTLGYAAFQIDQAFQEAFRSILRFYDAHEKDDEDSGR